MAKGLLITIEAGDGCGKATQTRLLAERLQKAGRNVKMVTYPDYASDSSALVRMYLGGAFGEKADSVNPYAASTFFAVDRYASYRLNWQKEYESGAIIMADRYTTSNMVHQAVKIADGEECKRFLSWLWDFEFGKLGLPIPDRVIFLDMAPEVAEGLIAARSKETNRVRDIHEKDREYLQKCHAAYGEIAKEYGWHTISCSENGRPRPIMEIHERIYKAIEDLL